MSMILRLALSAVVMALCCSTAGAAGWSYKLVQMFDDKIPTATATAADGRQAIFMCFPGRQGIVFTTGIEIEDNRPNHRGEQHVDYDKLKVTVKWTVDGAAGSPRKWEKQGLSVTADAAASAAVMKALRSAERELVVTWGRKSVTYTASGAGKALGSLAKACGA